MSKYSNCIADAALQNELIRKLKLTTISNNNSKKRISSINNNNSSSGSSSRKTSLSSSLVTKKKDILCNSCNNISSNDTICSSCGFFIKSIHQPTDTLAQRLGLVQPNAPINTVSRKQWDTLEAKLKEPDHKLDTFCPICMEAFNQGTEVLLSCSHMFHRQCLTSFEKFMKISERACPICRQSKYQKKLTNIGSKSYEIVCSIIIQKYWRRYHVQSKYRSLQRYYPSSSIFIITLICYLIIRQYYKTNNGQESIRKKFYEKELSIYTQKLEKDIDNRKDEVDSMMDSMDNTLRESRELDQLFDFVLQQRMMMNRTNNNNNNNFNDDDDYRYSLDNSNKQISKPVIITEREWRDIEMQVRTRAKGYQGFGECAIWYF
jgi:hypothetical protein